MTIVKRNIIANYLGQGWTGFMALAFLPLYIEYLGMEAYGLIGLFAVMQALLMLLDIGMTPTLNREMARFSAGAHSAQSIRDLLRSLEVICYSLAALSVVVVWAASGYLAKDWIKAEQIPIEVVGQVLSIMALVVALRVCEGIYRGSLYGLERQVWYNGAYSLLTTLRYGGAVVILEWVSTSIEVFFIWQAVVSLLTVAVLAFSVHRILPRAPSRPRFSRTSLTEIWKFAGGMMAITFLTMLLLQVDKVLLSRLLPLKEFGYYTLAATAAGVLYMIVVPVTQAVYPRMVKYSNNEELTKLIVLYHQTTQLIIVLIAPAVVVLGFFAGGVVYMWSGNADLAKNTAPLLSILTLGSFLNSLSYIPYNLQLAHGWISFLIKTNTAMVFVLISVIFWVVPRYGSIGAAWTWAALNGGYLLVTTQFMHRRIIPKEKWSWYIIDVLLPVIGTVAVTLLAQQVQPENYQDRMHWFLFLLLTGVVSLLISAVLASTIRARLKSYLLG